MTRERRRCGRRALPLACAVLLIAGVAGTSGHAGAAADDPGLFSQGGNLFDSDGTGFYDCNPTHALCDEQQPMCFRAGTVPFVEDGCWGECVEFSACTPIRCSSSSTCPFQAYCGAFGVCTMDDGNGGGFDCSTFGQSAACDALLLLRMLPGL